MQERRHFVRLSVRVVAHYQVTGRAETQTGWTRNVGGGGISLFTEERLEPGTVVAVELVFPERPAPVTFTAEVIWSGALLLEDGDRRPHAFETGVRFRDITPADRKLILQRGAVVPPTSDTP